MGPWANTPTEEAEVGVQCLASCGDLTQGRQVDCAWASTAWGRYRSETGPKRRHVSNGFSIEMFTLPVLFMPPILHTVYCLLYSTCPLSVVRACVLFSFVQFSCYILSFSYSLFSVFFLCPSSGTVADSFCVAALYCLTCAPYQ